MACNVYASRLRLSCGKTGFRRSGPAPATVTTHTRYRRTDNQRVDNRRIELVRTPRRTDCREPKISGSRASLRDLSVT
jgi:hypothetical protein